MTDIMTPSPRPYTPRPTIGMDDPPASGTAAWHELRASGIGGSDVEAMMGQSRFKTRHQLWRDKIGLAEPSAGSSATRRGTILEPAVASEFARVSRERLELAPQFVPHAQWDSDHPVRLLANPDAVTRDGRVVELKTTTRGSWVHRQGRPLISWIYQVHHYAETLRSQDREYRTSYAWIGLLVGPSNDPMDWTTGGAEVITWEIALSDDLRRLIRREAMQFWRSVERGRYHEGDPSRRRAAYELAEEVARWAM